MRILVVAKAPVPGAAKTRLGTTIGDQAAARVAAAALADTIAVASSTVGPTSCHLALAGDLGEAVEGHRLRALLAGWTVTPQRGGTFAERLVNAHVDAGDGDVVQVGMDTPQLTPALLRGVAAALADHDAALGPADDGGWWVLGRRDPAFLQHLAGVRMSAVSTYADTWAALVAAGASVTTVPGLRDVDTLDDARAVADDAPATEFARTWAAVATR